MGDEGGAGYENFVRGRQGTDNDIIMGEVVWSAVRGTGALEAGQQGRRMGRGLRAMIVIWGNEVAGAPWLKVEKQSMG